MEHVSGINDRKLKNVMRCFAFIFLRFQAEPPILPNGELAAFEWRNANVTI